MTHDTRPKTVAIIGAGPAGLAAYKRIREDYPWLRPLLFEAGPCLQERMAADPEEASRTVVNGMGGAGLYSDRKISTLPSGSGQLRTNPYELRDSYQRVLGELSEAVPTQAKAFGKLLAKTEEFLGDNTVSSEAVERKTADMSFGSVKLYPTVVLSDFKEAVQLISAYQLEGEEGDEAVRFNCAIEDVREADDGRFVLSFDGGRLEDVDYVVLAMGRFGSLTAERSFEIFRPTHDRSEEQLFQRRRLEIGVRVDVASHPPLREALLQLGRDNDMVFDPKLTLRRTCVIDGRTVECEFRTFCVCVPSDDAKEGYVVRSHDVVSSLETFSGSSSFDELTKRSELPHVTPGSNLGIMMRIVDDTAVDKYVEQVSARCLDGGSESVVTKGDDLDATLAQLAKYFTSALAYPLYTGIIEMITAFSGQSVTGPLKLHMPCIEGTGLYPRVDPRTYQHSAFPNLFVAGDMVGHTRGLLQGLVLGDVVGKAVATHATQETLLATGVMHDYQSSMLPSFGYNKTVIADAPDPREYALLAERLEEHFLTSLDAPEIRERATEISTAMHRVCYTGESDRLGVIYELHHFFLDASVYGDGQLHYISQRAMIEYILLCNVVERHRQAFAEAVCRHLRVLAEADIDNLTPEQYERLVGMIEQTFSSHQFKSCVLALRTRTSLEERQDYTDIPVMQSAYKVQPVSRAAYDLPNHQRLEVAVTSIACALLDGYWKHAIDAEQLSLLMVRSKIETQEPAIASATPGAEPPYLECHVKVNIKETDGRPAEYYAKKHIIQELASLFEGDTALLPRIFKVISVSINLLKHPEHGQQFFLTYRTDTKEQMAAVRKHFAALFKKALQCAPADSELHRYQYQFLTDAEFVIYDDNRELDRPWFPVTEAFLHSGWKTEMEHFLAAPRQLFIATTSRDKMDELRSAFAQAYGNQVYLLCAPSLLPSAPDAGDLSLLASAAQKARAAYAQIERPVLAESTGLQIAEMNGFPGATTKEILAHIGPDAFVQLAAGLNVTAQTVLAYHDGLTVHNHIGVVHGHLVRQRGDGGFGWDSLFVPAGSTQTFAEMSAEEKAQYSMRSRALTDFFSEFSP